MTMLTKEIQITRADQPREKRREDEKDYLAKAKQFINKILSKYRLANVREFYFLLGADRSMLKKSHPSVDNIH